MSERIDFNKEDITKEQAAKAVDRAVEEMQTLRMKLERNEEKLQLGTALLERTREIVGKMVGQMQQDPRDTRLQAQLQKLSDESAKAQETMAALHTQNAKFEEDLKEFDDEYEYFQEILKTNLDS